MSPVEFPLQKWFSGPFSKWPPAKTAHSVIIVNVPYLLIQTSYNIYFIEYLIISRHEEFTAIKILIFKYSFMPKSKMAAKFRHFPIKSHNF